MKISGIGNSGDTSAVKSRRYRSMTIDQNVAAIFYVAANNFYRR